MANINPIRRVGNVTVPPPSAYTWKLEDTSAPNAGRTEDGVMQKNRIGQVVALELAWNNISDDDMHTIVSAFNPQYIDVVYKDPLTGDPSDGYFTTLKFYVGNRSAPMYNATMGLWTNISFSIIDKNGALKE